MTVYNKLVRDKIPEILDEKGVAHTTHIADDREYWIKLKEKLVEEVAEFQKDESREELADILEVIDGIKKYKNYSDEDILEIKNTKVADRGAFDKRIILEES
jgi:predicted house-cleaning noncanonical NTP pyrophosphatase (MazG superfamily)